MEQLKAFSKKIFWIITLYCLPIAFAISYGLYLSMKWVLNNLSEAVDNDVILQHISLIISYVQTSAPYFIKAVIPSVVLSVLLLGWLLWLILRYAVKSGVPAKIEKSQKRMKTRKKDFLDRKLEQDRKRRLFLHTLSILQREGRLLDFFEEDLSLYEDDQIGAAVRSIQEDCKKTIKKYIDPKAVLDREEGADITIEEDFDIDSITLTGNVAGKPPFQGVVKHSGWKAGKQDLPKLSDIKDAAIIVPAEVEIQ